MMTRERVVCCLCRKRVVINVKRFGGSFFWLSCLCVFAALNRRQRKDEISFFVSSVSLFFRARETEETSLARSDE